MTTRNFKSEQKYRNWLNYKFSHGLSKGGHDKVIIAGKPHKVNFS